MYVYIYIYMTLVAYGLIQLPALKPYASKNIYIYIHVHLQLIKVEIRWM